MESKRMLNPQEAERLRSLLKGLGRAAYGSFLAKTGERERALTLARELLRELACSIAPEDGEHQVHVRARALMQKKLAILELEQAQAAWEELEAQRVPVYTRAARADAPKMNSEKPSAVSSGPKATPWEWAPPSANPAEFSAPLCPLPPSAGAEQASKMPVPGDRSTPVVPARPDRPEPSAKGDAGPSAPCGGFRPKPPSPAPRRNPWGMFFEVLCTILLVLLCLALTWCALGLAMKLGYLPFYDLGYQFFNCNIYPLF